MACRANPVRSAAGGDRIHALDAFRSSMMLLGILLHIAWFFMPTYAGQLGEDQILSVIAYLKSLSDPAQGGAKP